MANQYKNKVVFNGTTLIDLSDTTAVQSDVASGKFFYTASGEKVLGTAETGGSSGYTRTVVVPEQTVTPVYHSSDTTNGYFAQLNNVTEMFEQWSEYIVTFNGTEYYFTTILMWGSNYLFGEQGYLWSGTSGTEYPYPFCIISTSVNDSYIYTASADSVTVKIEKLELTGSSSGTGQIATGTVTGNGTTILEIPCDFAPDLIYVYGDMSGNVANRGIVSLMIIKDVAIYASNDTSTSSIDEYATVLHDITGYNESDTSTIHATYSNNTLTINTVTNTTSGKWRSGQIYNYELSTIGTGSGSSSPTLVTKEITSNGTYTASNDSADGYSSVTVNVPSSGITPTGSINITINGTHDVTNYASAVVNVPTSGGSTPSATKHTIHFDFSDETDTDIDVYYDDALFTTMIQEYTPITYGSKTVTLAQLDGVTWYEPVSIPLNTQLIDYNAVLTGYTIGSDGNVITSEAWNCVTDYTPINQTMTFSFKCSQYASIGFYDKNKNPVSVAEANEIKESVEDYTAFGYLTPSIIPPRSAYVVLCGNAYGVEDTLSLIRTV